MHKLLLIAAIFVAGFITGAQFHSSPEHLPANQSATVSTDNQRLRDQLAALNRYVQELESRPPLTIESGSSVLTQTPSLQSPSPHAATINPDAKELQRLREYQFNNELEKHQARLKNLDADVHTFGTKMEQQFSAEAIDMVWADEKQFHLNAAIEQDEDLRVLPNLSSECRSRQCRLSILTKDADQLANLNASLNKIVTQQKLFDSYTVVVDEKTYSTQVYFDHADATR